MVDRTKQMGEAKVSSLLIKFSLPAIIGTMASSVYMIIDRLFVGNIVGADAIAGMSITMPISFILMAFGMLIGIGSGTLVSIRLGQSRREEAEDILGNAFLLLVVLAAVLTSVLVINLEHILTAFGASPKILPYGHQFISIILYGSVFQFISFGLSAVIRAEGNPRIAMLTVLINAGLNIVLDAVFIYLLGWGVKGTAVATVISQAVSATWVLAYFRSRHSLLRLRLSRLRPRPTLIRQMVILGSAPFSIQMVASVINMMFNHNLSVYGGDAAIGAFGIINTIIMFIFMPIFGINQGAQPIIGFNYGARQLGRCLQTLKYAQMAAVAIGAFGLIVLELFSRQLLSAFTPDTDLIRIGVPAMKILVAMMPVAAFQIVGSNFFQAIGKAGKAMLLSLMRQVIVLIPLLVLLPPLLKLKGVWVAMPASDLISAIVTAVFLLREISRMRSADAAAPAFERP